MTDVAALYCFPLDFFPFYLAFFKAGLTLQAIGNYPGAFDGQSGPLGHGSVEGEL